MAVGRTVTRGPVCAPCSGAVAVQATFRQRRTSTGPSTSRATAITPNPSLPIAIAVPDVPGADPTSATVLEEQSDTMQCTVRRAKLWMYAIRGSPSVPITIAGTPVAVTLMVRMVALVQAVSLQWAVFTPGRELS